MIRSLYFALLCLSLPMAACTTTRTTPEFSGDKVSMTRASDDNVALAVQYLNIGNRNAAMEKVQKAIDENPDNANAYTAEALIYSADGDQDKARDAYKKAMREAPGDPEILNDYGRFLCQNGKPKDAIDYFLQAANNPRYSTPDSAYENAGLCELLIPDQDLAEQYFRKSLQINPRRPEPMFQLAEMAYNQKKYLTARAFIERYNELVPNSRPDVLLLGVNNERALGNQQGATEYAKQLLRLYPASQQAQELDQVPRG